MGQQTNTFPTLARLLMHWEKSRTPLAYKEEYKLLGEWNINRAQLRCTYIKTLISSYN